MKFNMEFKEPELYQTVESPMKLALELAKHGRHTVSPNPMVGAVIIKDNKLVGFGYHLFKGDTHAEVKAIDMAGSNAKGAKLYLNLEPCCHYGVTPPCVDKVIESGIAEVHFSSIDPNPLVQGKSVEKLKQAGIKVIIGELKEEAENLNEIFF
ncbi:MAG: bifunctional diaminohydroxyphosphoribosylaminopyrimidine deaminase/5-amino-6-(5-phosphoribosylamino)uracil reductase RibD, partial [Pseudomonadota bacterium]